MVSATAFTAFADELAAGQADLPWATTPVSSQIGTTTWTLDASGTLTIASADGNSGTLPSTADFIDDELMEDQAKGYEEAEGWRSEYKQAKKLVFQGAIAFPSSSQNAFEGFSIESVSSGAGSSVSFAANANCGEMFKGCRNLKDISGLEHWNMSSVVSAGGMFRECINLKKVSALSTWVTSSLTSTSFMFSDCTSLSDISALSEWDIPSVESTMSMFWGCTSLSDVSPLSGWDVSSVYDMAQMFEASPVSVGS